MRCPDLDTVDAHEQYHPIVALVVGLSHPLLVGLHYATILALGRAALAGSTTVPWRVATD